MIPWNDLVSAARSARTRAYARYSQYAVGAALWTAAGEIVAGCNIENASYGLTVCAERVALQTAVSAGDLRFAALAVVTADGGAPCGACRQVLAEFCDDLPIALASHDPHAPPKLTSLAELLPQRFRL